MNRLDKMRHDLTARNVTCDEAAAAVKRALQVPHVGTYTPTPTEIRRLSALQRGGRDLQAERILLRRIAAST